MAGRKTHEEQLRILERKPDVPDARREEAELKREDRPSSAHLERAKARQSEFPVSWGGMHQESRGQDKHNRLGQAGHKPQKHTPEQEKH